MVSFMMTIKRRKVENDNNRFIIINPSKTCLCDDIVSTILLKLPVESLIRFTSVSKSWNSLIRSPTFIATYNNLILHRRRYLLYVPNKRCRALPPFVTSTDDDERRSNIKMPHDSYRVVGSCKGLVCVQDINNSQVYLWNPLLRTSKTIPPSPSEEATNAGSYNVFGLGYSRNNNDYKIVKIIYSTKFSVEDNKVEIYSMKFNSWKSIDSAEVPSIALEGIGVYIKGCVRWIGLTMSPTRPFIKNMWFDIDKESFGETDFPSQGLRLKYLREPADQWPQSADVKELLKDCEDQYHRSKSCSLWKTKALACENSHVLLQLNWRDQLQVKHVKIFDGEILFRTECKNMINFLGVNAVTPLEKKDVRMSEFFNVVCVSESLMLLGHKDE